MNMPIPDGVRSLVDHLEKNPSLQFIVGNALVMESEDQREFLATYGGSLHTRFFALPFEQRHKEMYRVTRTSTFKQPYSKRRLFRAIGG